MKKLIHIILAFTAFCFAGSWQGCISDEFTTSPTDLLTFSTDTVSFDTVFTDLGTPTARLKVFNKAKKSVNISSIKFKNPDSYFAMNVDGVSDREFKDVEIRGNDSIFVFIECYIPETQQTGPQLVEDKLEFVTNGVTQQVTVEAYGQNVIRLKNFTVTEDMEMGPEMPYVVFDSLVVEKEATLKILPGANILFHDKASLVVKGTIDARGEPGRMINMRGDRLDNVLPDVGYDILAGQWKGVYIRGESFDNHLEYVDMRSTVDGLRVDSCADLSRQKLLLVNSWIHNSQSTAFKSEYAWVDAYGCVFSEAAEAAVSLTGGKHEFVQCTFSNYYLFSVVSDPLVCLYHLFPEDLDGNSNELMKADFLNCILYGMPSDLNEGDLEGSDVYFKYTSLKSAGTDDDHFISCLWDTDPLFYTIREDYYFNYRLKEGSPVIGAGNPAYVSAICLYDMDGLNRLSGGNPDLGAYVYVPAPAE